MLTYDQVTQTSRLTYRTVSGCNFLQPTLTPNGIVVCEYLYKRADIANLDGDHPIVIASSGMVFNMPYKPTVWREDSPWGTMWLIPATVQNLQTFVLLPELPADQRTAALDLLYRWSIVLPTLCLQAIILKASTEPVEGSLRRLPATRSRKLVETLSVRPLSPDEIMGAMMGRPLPTDEERTEKIVTETVESTPFDEALFFQRYSSLPLYSQQLLGAWIISQVKRLGVFYDMRVGKTKTAWVAAKHALAQDEVDFVVVVCPRTNMYDPWLPEAERAGFKVVVLDGSVDEDTEAINLRHREARPDGRAPTMYIVNFERLGSRLPLMYAAWDMRRIFVIGDETSAIKNPKASRSKAMHEFCEEPLYVVLLNGTPMEQGPQDLWSQMRCIDPAGVKWGHSYGEFVDRFLEEVAPGKYRVKTDRATRRDFEMLIMSSSVRYIRSEADQFAGKDKNFRYIEIRPTKHMAENMALATDGYIKVYNEAKTGGQTAEVNSCVLALYGTLRELSCGYDKYRESEDGPYLRVRHQFDPKILWVLTFLEANPTEPLVVFCEFDEQEQRLKEELNRRHILWSGTKPEMRVVTRRRLRDYVPTYVYRDMVAAFPSKDWVTFSGTEMPNGNTLLPTSVQYDQELCEFVAQKFWSSRHLWEEFKTYKSQEYSAQERAEQIARFNRGETHVIILKTSQGRGISLSRTEAVANGIGTYPTIVFMAPPWSLGTWEQAQDRCVAVDSSTQKNVCTMIYALTVPGIERRIMRALRAKKEVQSELLEDVKREGFSSFAQALTDEVMTAASAESAGFFDADEMFARMNCGVPPAAKLTERNVLEKLIEKHGKRYGWKNRQDVLRWLQQEPVAALNFNEDGVCLNPDAQIRESYFKLADMFGDKKKEVA